MRSLASITGILGALLLALNLGYNYEAYYVFLLSSTLWSIDSVRTHNQPLLYMNLVFSVINLIGIVSYRS